MPSITSRGNRAALAQLDLDLRFDESRVAGAAVVAGSTASVSMRGDDLSFKTDATIADVDLQQIGREFGVPALESERYEGRLGGRVVTDGTITGLSGGVTLDNVQADRTRRSRPVENRRPGHRPRDA